MFGSGNGGMKPWKEYGVVLEGNKRVGFLLQEYNPNNPASTLQYASEAQFTQLVSQGMVQDFVFEGGSYKVEYSKSELKRYKKEGKGNKVLPQGNKEYFNNDIRIQLRHIQSAMNGGMPYFITTDIMPLQNMNIVLCDMIHANAAQLFKSVCGLCATRNMSQEDYMKFMSLLNGRIGMKLLYESNNMVSFGIPETGFKDFMSAFNATVGGYNCNCSQLKRNKELRDEIIEHGNGLGGMLKMAFARELAENNPAKLEEFAKKFERLE